jgi:cell division protein FtsI (penicillin-binding protein 3)
MTLVLLFVALAGLIGIRLADLAVLHERDPGGREAFVLPSAPRADMFDRNGVELARTFDAVAVAVAPRKLVTRWRWRSRWQLS